MSSLRYSHTQLEKFCCAAFEKLGFSAEEAAKITDVLILADLYGIESHGTQRLIRYYKAIMCNSINVKAKPEIVFETPISAVIDGNAGMGQIISDFSMKLAIEKAKKSGVGIVTVRNSNHFGIAGYYAKMACDEGFFGMATTNSESIMVHTYSKQPILGSNPIAVSMPAEPYPFLFDAATTVVPRGKLEVYNKKEKELYDSWAVDETGKVCRNAQHVLDCIISKSGGGILPLGGASEETGSHKGYGYAMLCEILSAILSGGATSNHHVRATNQGAGSAHSFIAISLDLFGNPEEIKNNMSVFLEELRNAPKADGCDRIYTHGEKEIINYEDRIKNGFEVNINTIAELKEICNALGMDSSLYFNDQV